MARRGFFIFEHHQDPIASHDVFMQRIGKCLWLAIGLLLGAIFIGAAVYHFTEGLDWLEATLNAVLVMTGLGLEDTLHTAAAKLFTCFYALFAAVVFYAVLGIIFAPLIHRFLHQFHLELERKSEDQ